MNLQLVTGKAFRTHCKSCDAAIDGGSEPWLSTVSNRVVQPDLVYADLDGTPFEAYYCETCANNIRAGLPCSEC